jgi:protein gp37
MSFNSAIEWTKSTWNPMTGCTKISLGCKNCYAERMAKRLQAMGQTKYSKGFKLTLHPHMLNVPLKWKKPQMIFVNSMSDIFHEDAPKDFIKNIFSVMAKAHWHIFQVLTKRSERLLEFADDLKWESNIWMGVTVESADYDYRIEHLRQSPAKVKWLSFEPLLGALPELNLDGLNWVVVGGESGPRARIMRKEWVTNIKEQCERVNIPFFFKQWGGINKKKSGRMLEGRTWDDMPPVVHPQLKLAL